MRPTKLRRWRLLLLRRLYFIPVAEFLHSYAQRQKKRERPERARRAPRLGLSPLLFFSSSLTYSVASSLSLDTHTHTHTQAFGGARARCVREPYSRRSLARIPWGSTLLRLASGVAQSDARLVIAGCVRFGSLPPPKKTPSSLGCAARSRPPPPSRHSAQKGTRTHIYIAADERGASPCLITPSPLGSRAQVNWESHVVHTTDLGSGFRFSRCFTGAG